jgi:DNA repair photolyase
MGCLEGVASVNVAAGCAHQCVYCYARGYPHYPGDGVVAVYDNLVTRMVGELSHIRRWPRAVYFCPATDPFQPVDEVQEVAYGAMAHLLERGVRVGVLTKGVIAPRFHALFARHADLVDVQIGINTADDSLQKMLEPNAATPVERLAAIWRLREAGVHVEARIDPLMPGITDTDENLSELFSRLASVGVDRATLNYIFLRNNIRNLIAMELPEHVSKVVLDSFRGGVLLQIVEKGSGCATALSPLYRRAAYERTTALAAAYGIRTQVCSCKNPDVAGDGGTCTGVRRAAAVIRRDNQKRLMGISD